MTEKLLEEIRDILTDIRDSLRQPVQVGEGSNLIPNQGIGESEIRPWNTYLEEKNPKNDYEIIALVVDHLTNTAGPPPTKKTITDFFRVNPDRLENTDSKPLSDAIDSTKNNRAYRYIEYADSDKAKSPKVYRLSIKGKQLVEKLPERSVRKKHGKNRT